MSVARWVARALRRRSGTAGAIFVLTLGGALAVSRLSPTRYRATAEDPAPADRSRGRRAQSGAITSRANAEREVNTNAELITSKPVIDSVRARLHLTESARELIDRVSVSGAGTSYLVEIAVTDLRPRRAADIATAVAVEYQAYRRRSDQDAIGSAVEAAKRRLLAMDDAARRSPEGRGLEARLHQLETDAAVATGGVQVVRRAAVPWAPVPRIPPLAAAEILGLALVLAALAAATVEWLDRRLTDRRAVEEAFGHPVIGRIPAASRGHDPERVEAFVGVAASLRRSDPGPPGRIVLVTAGVPSPGNDAAIRLAEALAAFEPRILLIDADLRHERSPIGGIADAGGLTALLCGQSTLDDKVMLASYDRAGNDSPASRTWELLAAGRAPAVPPALLGSHEMRGLLAVARRRTDVVVVAAPSMTAGADVLRFAPLCDETIIVVRERAMTRRRGAPRARRARGRVGPRAVDILEVAAARSRGRRPAARAGVADAIASRALSRR